MTSYETIIIGAGPAGLSAALVLGRCMRHVLVIDSGRYRNERSNALHCFLGSDGIAPRELLERSRRQLERYTAVTYRRAMVREVSGKEGAFSVELEDGTRAMAATLLIATGVVDELPPLLGIDEFYGRSVHICPYCDAWNIAMPPWRCLGRVPKVPGSACCCGNGRLISSSALTALPGYRNVSVICLRSATSQCAKPG
jgi:thioredoxin reductase